MNRFKPYQLPFLCALGLHLFLFLLIFFHIPSKPKATPIEALPAPKTIEAVSVDAKTVEETVKKIQAAKQRAERLKREEAERIQTQKRLAQKELAQIQANKKRMENDMKKAERLAKAQKQKALEAQKQLAKALAEKEALEARKKKQAELEKQRALDAQKEKARLAAEQAEINRYKTQIVHAIGQHWIVPDPVDKHLSCEFLIRLAPGGVVLSVTLQKSSGNPVLDRSAKTAILKASPLPVPKDPHLFNQFRALNLVVRPEDI